MVPDAHLLIVDDDERIRALLQKFLVRNGFLVSVARDAAQARRILGGLEFDLIVMDVMMPGEDGVTLTRELRKRMGTPILLLTARFAADALRERYFGWNRERFPAAGEHNLLRAQGQWALHKAALATRAARAELLLAGS